MAGAVALISMLTGSCGNVSSTSRSVGIVKSPARKPPLRSFDGIFRWPVAQPRYVYSPAGRPWQVPQPGTNQYAASSACTSASVISSTART